LQDICENTRFIMGAEVKELEDKLADYTKAKYAIGCASGTDALQIALMALNLNEGDEVITTPFTFFATGEVIALLKLKPVFVDIDASSYNINANLIEEKITAKTKAIIPVSLYGQCADMDAINQIAAMHNIPVIEDAAQSFGAEYKDKKIL
jgi:UDP-2-acetamido-2-deoxy-ribo-hexuluronate aminotransferase